MAEPLSSDKFAEAINKLHKTNPEAMYVALHHWLDHTGKLMGIESAAGGVDWAANAKSGSQMVNDPLMAGILNSPMEDMEKLEGYRMTLGIPHIKRDPGAPSVVKETLRIATQYGKVNNELPGMLPAWDEFVHSRIKRHYYASLNDVVENGDEVHQKFMYVMHHVATGDPSEPMAEWHPELDALHALLKSGETELLADNLYNLYTRIFDSDIPDPPESGGGGDSGEGEGEGEDDEGEGGQDPQDILDRLGNVMSQMAANSKPTGEATAKMEFKSGNKSDIDPERLMEIDGLKADVSSVLNDGSHPYGTFEVVHGMHQEFIYDQFATHYDPEINEAREIINEQFRTQFSTLRGMKSGKIDANRLYRVGMDQNDVFRVDALDSLGKMDIVLIVDESGSMSANVAGSKRSSFPKIQPFSGSETNQFRQDGSFEGKGPAYFSTEHSRSGLALALSVVLMEAVRDLNGINLDVAGYGSTGIDRNSTIKSAMEAAMALKSSDELDASIRDVRYLNSFVRKLGDKTRPYGLVQADAYGGNADLEALDYAYKRLENSRAPHKAIIYLADGQTYGDEGTYKQILEEAQREGIYVFWFDLSNQGIHTGSPFRMLDRAAVNSVDDMLEGLSEFLTNMVQIAGRI